MKDDRQGDFFDPEAALNRHAEEAHNGETRGDCGTCRDLAAAIVDSGETYTFTGTGTCRYCPAELLWFGTPDRSQLPVDRERFLEAHPELAKPNALRGFWTTRSRGRTVVLPYSHWSTCPGAARARADGPGAWFDDDPGRSSP